MARKKELYLHIGTVKTGTTALQQFFSANRDVLRKKGIVYPINRNGFAAHHRLSWSLYRIREHIIPEWPEDMASPKDEWHTMKEQLNGERNIISSEFFIRYPPRIISLLKRFTSDFRVKIIVYWRRRDLLEDSWYNQRVKRGGIRNLPSSRHELTSRENLTLWANIFGKENVILRPYERRQLYQGDILADFLHHILGLELTNEFILPEEETNSRLHRIALEYKRQVNHLPIPILENRKVINPLLDASDMLTGKGRKSYPVFSPQQRLQLIEEYAEENAAIAREFLGREDGKLFYDPPPDLDEDWQAYDELLEEDTQLINNYLAENHPDGLRIITQGILQAQYSDNGEIKQAALKLLPGITPSHISSVLIRNLKNGVNKDVLFVPQSQMEQIYSSRTWKAGMMLKRIYNRLPSGLQKILLAIARIISRKIQL